MRRTIPSGRTRCAPSSVLTDTNRNQRGPVDLERDLCPSLIRLAQRYLEACRGNRPMTAVLERVWRRFYAETDPLVRSVVRVCRKTGDEREDRVQEGWAEIIVRLPGYHHDPERGPFRNWVFVLVRNALIKRRRGEGTRPMESLPPEIGWLEGRESDPSTNLDRFDRCLRVRRALVTSQALIGPVAYRIVILHYVASLTQDEVANRLGLTAGQVRGHLDRSRPKIRSWFERAIDSIEL
jgi:RNA polymerase sigma factor (sigma-70 family)